MQVHAMSPRASLLSFIIIGLAAQSLATDGGHGGHSELPSCPASCIQTVTVTATASCSELPPSLETSTASYLQTHTNDGIYVNATGSESAVVPSTTVVIEPTGSITESDPEATSSLDASSSAIPTPKPNKCHHNNCLRQFIRHTQVTDFCATYTTTVNTATTDLPDYVSQCHADPTRISSACSCIVTPISPSGPVSTNPSTTKTAEGVYTYEPSPTTDPGCSLASVVFETHTTTTTISVTVSAGADISISSDASEIEVVTTSAAISSFTSIPYFNSTSLATSTT